MKCLKNVLGLFLLMAFSVTASAVTVDDVTETLMGPTQMITKLMLAACYIIGVILIFAAMAQYKTHRQSPKLVPLATPIILVVLGVISLLIPYVTKQFETGDATAQEEVNERPRSTLPLPDLNKGPSLPLPNRPVDTPAPPTTDTQSPSLEQTVPEPGPVPGGEAPSPDQNVPPTDGAAPTEQPGHWTNQ